MLNAAALKTNPESRVQSLSKARMARVEPMPPRATRRLADYRGSWLLLFSQPEQDGTGCTHLIREFSSAYPKFREIGCELLFLLYPPQHLRSGAASGKVRQVDIEAPFPVIHGLAAQSGDGWRILKADGELARLRVANVIDAQGTLRSRTSYPTGAHCSADGLLFQVRTLQAMDQMAKSRDDQASPWYF